MVSHGPTVDGHEPKCVGAIDELDSLRQAIERAAHLLPAQGPITVFVHHNTLHAFEHLPFEEALRQGAKTFGCHPYLSYDRYWHEHISGRIRSEDLDAVLLEDLGDRADALLGFLGTRFHLRRAMLDRPQRLAPGRELMWIVAETEALTKFDLKVPDHVRSRLVARTREWAQRFAQNSLNETPSGTRSLHDSSDATIMSQLFEQFDASQLQRWSRGDWESFCLHALWAACLNGAKRATNLGDVGRKTIRHSELLLEATGVDCDKYVNDLLIRYCAAFLDQGMAEWPLPDRHLGFWRAFHAIYGQRFVASEPWFHGIERELQRIEGLKLSPLACIAESLQLMGVDKDEHDAFLSQTLLALRGWAGMIWQVECRSDRVAHSIPPGTLIEYLAVRLMLVRLAIAHVANESLGYRGPLNQIRTSARIRISPQPMEQVDQRAFVIFQLAQSLGWEPETLCHLSTDEWSSLLHEVASFPSLEQRRIFQLAYERRYRMHALSGLTDHLVSNPPRSGSSGVITPHEIAAVDGAAVRSSRPSFQLITCIDDREESLRRHVEEVDSDCETFGTAGFFAVAMYYRGAAEAHYTPLCPVIVRPQHYVQESVAYSLQRAERLRSRTRRTIGRIIHRVHRASRTVVGGWIAAILGALASIPLVMRILFPRMTSQLRRYLGGIVQPPKITQLRLLRTVDPPGPAEEQLGYSVDEMAGIVASALSQPRIGVVR